MPLPRRLPPSITEDEDLSAIIVVAINEYQTDNSTPAVPPPYPSDTGNLLSFMSEYARTCVLYLIDKTERLWPMSSDDPPVPLDGPSDTLAELNRALVAIEATDPDAARP